MQDSRLQAIRRQVDRGQLPSPEVYPLAVLHAFDHRRELLAYVDELSPYKEACDRVLKSLDEADRRQPGEGHWISTAEVRAQLMGEVAP